MNKQQYINGKKDFANMINGKFYALSGNNCYIETTTDGNLYIGNKVMVTILYNEKELIFSSEFNFEDNNMVKVLKSLFNEILPLGANNKEHREVYNAIFNNTETDIVKMYGNKFAPSKM